MKFGDYTGIDDVETLFKMVNDRSLDVDKRVMAVVDLSLAYDFDWHRFLDFVVDQSQPSVIRSEIFDKQVWDEHSIPVILEALKEDNDEIQFWASFALVSNRWYWQDSQLDKIISLLNILVQNDTVAPNMWRVGREALSPFELAFYSKNDEELLGINTYLISPRLEYFDFMMAQKNGEVITEPTLTVDRHWLQEKISIRFNSAKFGLRRPQPESYLLEWHIGYGKHPLYGALHQDGYAIVLTGLETSVRRFAEWYRTIISDEHVLRLYEWADQGELL